MDDLRLDEQLETYLRGLLTARDSTRDDIVISMVSKINRLFMEYHHAQTSSDNVQAKMVNSHPVAMVVLYKGSLACSFIYLST